MSQAPDAHVATVKAFLAAQYAGDFGRAFAEHASPAFTWTVGARDDPLLTAAIPWAGRVLHGEAGYRELTAQLFGEYEPLVFEAEDFHAAGDAVFVTGRFDFRHRRTGRHAISDWAARFDMRDGRIAGGRFYENTYAVAEGRRATPSTDPKEGAS